MVYGQREARSLSPFLAGDLWALGKASYLNA